MISFVFEKASIGDLTEIARIHKNTFSNDHFSSRLSVDLLVDYYYELLKFNEYCFVSRNINGKIIGYIISGRHTDKALKIFIRSNSFKILFYLLKSPLSLLEKVNAILFPHKYNSIQSNATIRFISIAIDKSFQGMDIASTMVKSFECELLKMGEKSYGLSVRKTNLKAIRFYEKMEFKIENISNKTIYYIKDI